MEPLSCPLCLKPHFQGVDELRSSLITVATSQISCPVCNEILMGLDKLTIHLFSHITLAENVAKPPEKNTEKQKKSRSHRPKEDQRKIPAKNDQTERSVDIDNYSQLIEESILTVPKECASKKTLRCDICNFCFSDENILEMHQKLLHQTQVDAKTGHYSYHCHLCSKKFKMRGSLMVHLRVAHYGFANQEAEISLGKNNNCQNRDVVRNIEKAEKSTDGKHWVCEVCSKQFTTKYFLKKHKRLHTGEMPYYCAQCNKSFTFQQSYHKHMLYHSSEKPHLCSECGRAFKELSTLHNHERIHSGERPFVCETCGKSFRQRVSYLVHRRIHTGAMPYKCTACDKSFRYKISQKSHKCPANPPGLVVRAPILMERLLEKGNEQAKEEYSLSNNADITIGHEDGHQSYNINVYPQQQDCLVTLENKEASLKNTISTVNTSLLTTANTLNLDHKFGNHVNTIIFNSEGQIIGQNFAFDGQNLIAISPKLVTIDCDQTSQSKINNNNDFENNSQRQYELMDSHTTSSQISKSCENGKSPDFLSMVLSPIIPDVQSLCLSSSPTNDHDDCSVKQEPLETINEESFKTLLDGLI